MGIVETNESSVVRHMQCQSVPDAVRTFRRHTHTRHVHPDPVAGIILDINISILNGPVSTQL